jgi:hypothetical protein
MERGITGSKRERFEWELAGGREARRHRTHDAFQTLLHLDLGLFEARKTGRGFPCARALRAVHRAHLPNSPLVAFPSCPAPPVDGQALSSGV